MEEGGAIYRRDRDEYLKSKQTKLNKPKNECAPTCGIETWLSAGKSVLVAYLTEISHENSGFLASLGN